MFVIHFLWGPSISVSTCTLYHIDQRRSCELTVSEVCRVCLAWNYKRLFTMNEEQGTDNRHRIWKVDRFITANANKSALLKFEFVQMDNCSKNKNCFVLHILKVCLCGVWFIS